MTPADAVGIAVLYHGLDDARSLRFFSVCHALAPFFERLTSAADRGGAGVVVVAVVVETDGDERIVCESSFEPLPNANGELAITMDRERRGWLGACLLDTLVAAASRRGVPNLEAEILARNGPRLALVRSRGDDVIPSHLTPGVSCWNPRPSGRTLGLARRRDVVRFLNAVPRTTGSGVRLPGRR